MKTAFMALGLCAIMYVVIASTYGSEYEVIKETATTTVESVEEEYPDEWLQEAEEAKNAVLRRKELEHELDIKNQQKDALEAEIEALERDLGTYWRSKSNIQAHIRQMFPEDPHTAIAIAKCESGLNPEAYNPHNKNGTTDSGLWQINDVHNETLDRLGLDKWDVEDSTKFARMLYEENGWSDWMCFTKGMLAMI